MFGLEKAKLDRISELSKKQRSVGLTQDEKIEQKKLRDEYLSLIRKNFKSVLENIEFTDDKK